MACIHGLPSAWCALCNRVSCAGDAYHGKKDDDVRVRVCPPIKGGIIPRFERVVRYPALGVGSTGERGSQAMRVAAAAAGKRATFAPMTKWGRQSVQDILKTKIV